MPAAQLRGRRAFHDSWSGSWTLQALRSRRSSRRLFMKRRLAAGRALAVAFGQRCSTSLKRLPQVCSQALSVTQVPIGSLRFRQRRHRIWSFLAPQQRMRLATSSDRRRCREHGRPVDNHCRRLSALQACSHRAAFTAGRAVKPCLRSKVFRLRRNLNRRIDFVDSRLPCLPKPVSGNIQ